MTTIVIASVVALALGFGAWKVKSRREPARVANVAMDAELEEALREVDALTPAAPPVAPARVPAPPATADASLLLCPVEEQPPIRAEPPIRLPPALSAEPPQASQSRTAAITYAKRPPPKLTHAPWLLPLLGADGFADIEGNVTLGSHLGGHRVHVNWLGANRHRMGAFLHELNQNSESIR